MEEKNKNKLIEIFVRRGSTNEELFLYNSEWRNEFLSEYGLETSVNYAEKLRAAAFQTTDTVECRRLEKLAKEEELKIASLCQGALLREGVDLEKIFSKDFLREDWKKEEMMKQLELLGINQQTADELGLSDVNNLKEEGKELIFSLENTEKKRDILAQQGIDFIIEENTLKIKGRMDIKEGISFEDNQEARDFLNTENIEYMEMAQNRNPQKGLKKLFVPFTWKNGGSELLNSQLMLNLSKLAMVAMTSLVITPGGAAILLLTLHKTGAYAKILAKKNNLSLMQRRALENGLTVFREDSIKTKYGKQKIGKYFYMDKGNLCSINAADVRIPNAVMGVNLSPAEKEILRKGELLELKDKRGNNIAVRIDLTQDNLIRKFYKELTNGREMTAVPNKLSDDKAKLSWIAKKGAEGIKDVYGRKGINIERDTFLSQYGIRTQYHDFISLSQQEKVARSFEKKEAILQEKGALSEVIRNIANNESNKINKTVGRGL